MCPDIAICSRTAEQRDARPPVRVQRIMATKISAAGTMITSDTWDVAILGSGIAGLAAALAAYEFGLRPVVLEKAGTLGGSTVSSYGLVWVGQNHLAQTAGYSDGRDEVLAYMRFLGGGSADEDRMATFVDRSPEALRFFEKCGIR